MISKLAWNTFKNTGNINTFLELKELQNLEKNITNLTDTNLTDTKVTNYGDNTNQRNNYFGK